MDYKKYLYILMNKPKGVLSAANDKSRKTVVDLVPEEFKRQGLFPVGRLDKDSEGMLILTNDGDFANTIMHPKKNIYKVLRSVLIGIVAFVDQKIL